MAWPLSRFTCWESVVEMEDRAVGSCPRLVYFVTFAWVYFRAPDIDTAHRVLLGPFTASWEGFDKFVETYSFELFLLLVFFVTHRYDAHARVRIAARTWNKGILWPIISPCLLSH